MKNRFPQLVGSVAPLLLIALLLGSAPNSDAKIISFAFEGRVTEVASEEFEPSGVVVGDPFWGTLTYDTTGRPYSIYGNRALYAYNRLSPSTDAGGLNKLIEVRVGMLHYPFTIQVPAHADDALINVENAPGLDRFRAGGEYTGWIYFYITLEDDSGTLLKDLSLQI